MPQLALNPHILKSVPLFSSFSDPQINALLASAQHRSYPRNAFIVRAGEETDALYIILSGRVKVLIPDAEGHEVRAEQIDRRDWELRARAAGMVEYSVSTLLAMFEYYERFGLVGNSNVLAWLLGRPSRPPRPWGYRKSNSS